MGLGRLFTVCLLSDCCQHEAKQRASSSRNATRIHGSGSARLRPYPEAEESNTSAREIADEKMKSSSTSDTTQTTAAMALAPTLPTHFDSARRLSRPRAPPSVPSTIASAQPVTQPTPAYLSSVSISNCGPHSLQRTTSATSIQTASATAPPGPTPTAHDGSAAVMRSIAIPSLTFNLRRLGCDLSTTIPLTSSSSSVSVWEDPDAAGRGPFSTAAFTPLSEVAPHDKCGALLWPGTHLNQEPCPLAPAQWQQQQLLLHAQKLRPQRSAPEPWEHNASTAAGVSTSAAAAAAAALEARNSLPVSCQQQLPPLHQHAAAHSVQIHTLRRLPEGGDLCPHQPHDFNANKVADAASSTAAQSLISASLTGLRSSGVLCPNPSRASCGGSPASVAAAASSSLQISLSGTERSPCRPSPSAGASIDMLSAPCTLPPSTATTPRTPLQAAAPSDLTGVIRPCRLSELAGQLTGLRWLASGSSGGVYTGLWQGSPVAVKVLLSSTPDQLRESTREALLSRVVSHPAICQCYTVCSECILPQHLQLPTARTAYSGRSATLSVTSIATPYNGNTAQSVSSSLSIHLNACGATGSSTCCGGGDGGGGGGGPAGCGPSMASGGFPSPRLGQRVGEEGEAISRFKSMSTVEAPEAAAASEEGIEVMPSVCSPGHGCQGRRLRLPSGRREPHRASVTQQQSSRPETAEADRSKAVAATAAGTLCGSPSIGAAAAGATLPSSTLAGVTSPAAPGDLLMHAGEAGGLTSASSPCSAAAAREVRCQGTLGCGSELYTTLSLSELLRTYAAADDDVANGGAAAGSLPAVLLSRGAAPGRCCTVVVMEWCKQGTLLQAIRSQPFNPERSAENAAGLLALLRTALEVAQGMAYLHSLDIIHGDLKPSNVLLQSHAAQVSRKLGVGMWAADMRGYVAKVADFGMSVPAHNNSIGTAVSGSASAPPRDCGGGGAGGGGGGGSGNECNWGALAYLAPEVPDSGPSKKSDVYSYGCVLYHMCTGEQPFRGIRQGRLLIGLATGALTLQWPHNVYRVLRRLGEACCATDPRQRPSFDKLVKALQKTIAYVTSTPSPGGSGASLTGSRKTLSGGRNLSQGSRRRRGSGCVGGAGAGGEEEEVATAAAAWRLALAGCGQLEGLELFAPLPAACGVPGSGAGRRAGGGKWGSGNNGGHYTSGRKGKEVEPSPHLIGSGAALGMRGHVSVLDS